jgi:hypothetical protein
VQIPGAQLRGKEEPIWADILDCLNKAGDLTAGGENLFSQLSISYDQLSPNQKQVFLDVACIHIGHDLVAAKALWGG